MAIIGYLILELEHSLDAGCWCSEFLRPRFSGADILPVFFESNGRDARATTHGSNFFPNGLQDCGNVHSAFKLFGANVRNGVSV